MGYAGTATMGGAGFVDFHSRKSKARKTGVFSDDENEEGQDDFENLYRRDMDRRTMNNKGKFDKKKAE
jgi:hypothetical protein